MKEIKTYTSAKTNGILLNANELPLNLPPHILEELKNGLSEIAFHRYPDDTEKELLESYAKAKGLDASQLLAGNGSDQMLGFVIGTFLGKNKILYTLDPDFSMYDYYASSYEAIVKKHKWNLDEDFVLDDFIQEGKEQNADMILFSNPNNPSGICLPLKDIKKILEEFKDIPVVIDEAYMEFSKEESAFTILEEYSNLYVTRTLSKAYGLAGVRIGFLAGSKENMESLKKSFVPYALSAVSQKIGSIVLGHVKEYDAIISEIVSERNRMYEAIQGYEALQIYPSMTNFLYGKSDKKDRLINKLKEKDIQIRDYAGTNAFRITIGTKKMNDSVLEILEEFEKENSK